eukprot:2791701-Prorocentrum_lima.AAC.1
MKRTSSDVVHPIVEVEVRREEPEARDLKADLLSQKFSRRFKGRESAILHTAPCAVGPRAVTRLRRRAQPQ